MRLLLFLLLIVNHVFAYDEFFKDSKRGWYWFEEKKKSNISPRITQGQAKQNIEQFKREMENARYSLFNEPTVKNMKRYLKLEEMMWKRAMQLYDTYELAKFENPEFMEPNVSSVKGVRLARASTKLALANDIKYFAANFDIVLVRSSDCQYCAEFEPVLKRFSDQYGFSVEAISTDTRSSMLFKTAHQPQLLKKFNITTVPTLMLVHKSSPIVFEFLRGFVTQTELEERFSIAKKYLTMKKLG